MISNTRRFYKFIAAWFFAVLGGLLILPGAGAVTYTGSPGPVAIPDNGSTSITFTVSGQTAPITFITVDVNLTHNWAGDIRLQLIAPNGTPLDLVNAIGGVAVSNENFVGLYTFVDPTTPGALTFSNLAGDVSFPLGSYATSTAGGVPTNLLSTFAALSTADINGTWTLRAYDLEAIITGTVVSSALNIGPPVSADLAITKTDGVPSVTAGGSTTYTITASNAGPNDAMGATVTDTFPASLTCTWTCLGAGSGACAATGSGNINDTVNLPANGSVTYTATCNVSASATGNLVNTANVSSGIPDPNALNNSATDTDTIIVNGACGTADGVATASAPMANFCSAGSASAVATAAGQFTWSCDGENGGTNASCAAPRTYTVTASVSGANGTAVGGGIVAYNAAGSVTITPDAGFFTVTPIGGTCDGSLSGTAFTTAPVIADCTVIASFTASITPTVSVSPAIGGSLSCTPQTALGGTSTCTVVLNPGYVVSSISGCGGTPSASLTYVTGPISAACVVSVAFARAAAEQVPVLGGLWAWLLAALAALASASALRRRNNGAG